MKERAALLDAAEAALARGDTEAALAGFERAAGMLHAPDTEMGLVRSQMQAGQYRRALAFAAHTAGAHLEAPAASALYAWLLRSRRPAGLRAPAARRGGPALGRQRGARCDPTCVRHRDRCVDERGERRSAGAPASHGALPVADRRAGSGRAQRARTRERGAARRWPLRARIGCGPGGGAPAVGPQRHGPHQRRGDRPQLRRVRPRAAGARAATAEPGAVCDRTARPVRRQSRLRGRPCGKRRRHAAVAAAACGLLCRRHCRQRTPARHRHERRFGGCRGVRCGRALGGHHRAGRPMGDARRNCVAC